MRTRNIAAVGVSVVVVGLALLWGFGGPPPGGSGQASSSPPAADSRAAAPAHAADRPLSSPVSAAPAGDVPALQARDQRRRAAIAPFGASLVGALDGCLTPGPGPRVPQRLVLGFQRTPEATPEHETFKLTSIVPADMQPGQPPLHTTPVGACLSALAGRTLEIPTGSGSQDSSFQEIIAIPIPASVAWAPPQPPQLPLR